MIGDVGSGQIEYLENNNTFSKIAPNSHTGRIEHLKYLPFKNGYVASASDDKTVNIWNSLTWTSIQTYTNHTHIVNSLDQIDNDTMVSGSDDSTIQIWRISTGVRLKTINVYAPVYAVRVF